MKPHPVTAVLLALALPVLVLVAACAPTPDFGAFPQTAAAPPPSLLPLDDLLAQANAPAVAETRAASLSARAARLRARAALMRGPVNAPETRARLAAAIARGAA
jgi:hypothetical protein